MGGWEKNTVFGPSGMACFSSGRFLRPIGLAGGRPGRLLMLERLIEHIKTFPNVEFMRAIDVAKMWQVS